MDKKFKFGFWNYVDTGVYGPEAVKDWVDCGMNLVLSPHFDPNRHNPGDLINILDECSRQNVKVIIDDKRVRWNGASVNPEIYKQSFTAAYEMFGKHPATYGFYVGDEPQAAIQFEDAIAAYRIQLEVAPELNPLLNFVPYWEGIEKDLNLEDTYEIWTEKFIEKAGLRMISYDCYTQMNAQDMVETGINNYYTNLNIYKKIAQKTGIPLWVSNLSVGHFHYRCPKEDDFRWQLNTTVASGANCIWWFFMYMRLTRVNYRIAPIDEHWERTETFEWLSRVQRSFQYTYGSLLSKLIYEKTMHCYKSYGGYPLFHENSDPFVAKITCDVPLSSILSYFHDGDGRKYMVIVNNSQTQSGCFTYYFDKSVKGVFRIAWGGKEVNVAENDNGNSYRFTDDGIKNNAWLAPGQMEVYRLEM